MIFAALCDTVCDYCMANLEEQMDPVCCSEKKPPSPHFQFSTLMNHNQIIHKLSLLSFRETTWHKEMFGSGIWVSLEREQQVNALAQSVISQATITTLLSKTLFGHISSALAVSQ